MTGKPHWQTITTQRAFDELLDISADFHDAFTASSKWQSAQSLDSEFNLILGGQGTLCLVIQSQFREVPQLELKFERVQTFAYSFKSDLEPTVEFVKGLIKIQFLEWRIEAEVFEYRRRLEAENV